MAKQKKRKNSEQFNQKFKKKRNRGKSVLVIALVAIILCIVTMGMTQLKKKEAEYLSRVDQLNTEIKALTEENAALEEKRKQVDSREFKEDVARRILGMVDPDEYVLEESDEITTEATTEKDATTEEEK